MFSFQKIVEVSIDARDVGNALMNSAVTNEINDEAASRRRRKRFLEITLDTPLIALSRFFERNSAAVVTERDEAREMRPVAVITKVDLLTWLMRRGDGSDPVAAERQRLDVNGSNGSY